MNKKHTQHERVVHNYQWLIYQFILAEKLMCNAPIGVLHGNDYHLDFKECNKAERDKIFKPLLDNIFNLHVFEFAAKDQIEMLAVADVHTANNIAKMGWEVREELRETGFPASNGPRTDNESDEKLDRFRKRVFESTAKVPFPDRLPFEATYIAWGEGVNTNASYYKLVTGCEWEPEMDYVTLIASIILASGYVYRVYIERYKSGETKPLLICERTPELGWMNPPSLTPWIIAQAIEAINECDTLVALPQLLSVRLAMKRLSKDSGHRVPPPPFYPVMVKPLTIVEKAATLNRRHIEWTHQWDVRGHWVIKLHRGIIPIEDALYQKLKAYNYTFFHALNPIDSDSLGILLRRGIGGPEEGEWIAMKRTWRDEFRKGPEDKPYIPSTHVLASRPSKGLGV